MWPYFLTYLAGVVTLPILLYGLSKILLNDDADHEWSALRGRDRKLARRA